MGLEHTTFTLARPTDPPRRKARSLITQVANTAFAPFASHYKQSRFLAVERGSKVCKTVCTENGPSPRKSTSRQVQVPKSRKRVCRFSVDCPPADPHPTPLRSATRLHSSLVRSDASTPPAAGPQHLLQQQPWPNTPVDSEQVPAAGLSMDDEDHFSGSGLARGAAAVFPGSVSKAEVATMNATGARR
jgi:hypothetical protein